jgi:serine/threonine protein kinase/tetratricopeptide (TPR) repeat protein
MTPERWKQIRQLAEIALEEDLAQRSLLLKQACKDDDELRAEVESLIASCEAAEGFLEAPALVNASQLFAANFDRSIVGSMIGPYRVIREIGRGGMGAVYLAVRDDDQYKKQVAIKLVRRGMDTDFIVDRFRHERQILASLDHPNIARLLDGGTTMDGLPYFVMEHIEGSPINQYCDDRSLSTTERVKLFQTVCSAVQYAHQNLVVHRDIKPSNIIVTPEGVPKLLDFGIAKLLARDAVGQSQAATVTMLRPMTPDYASPEQVLGRAITTAADIYSLGVLLYELLTGRRPYHIKRYTPQEIEEVICKQEPDKPSTAIHRVEAVTDAGTAADTAPTPEAISAVREAHPEKLRRRLRGDLDNIVLMAMRKEPQRRYASVEQFSEDLRRHLEGLPVIARKDTFRYRAEKFVRRHKIGMAMATVMLALVVGAIVIVLAESRRATRERDKAERVSAFLVDIFKVADPGEARGKTITAREILDKGAERLEVELKDQPEVQATLMNTVGLVYRSLGLYDSAAQLMEKSLTIRREVLGDEHKDVAKSLNDLGWVYIERQKPAEAEPLLREALSMRRRLLGNEHADVAESLNLLGYAMQRKGDLASSETLFRESLVMRRKLLGDHPDVAQSLSNLGLILHDKRDYENAGPLFEEAIALDRRIMREDHPTTAIHINNLALLKLNKGDFDGAEPLFREALEMARRLLGNDHPELVTKLNNLAQTLREKGDFESGEPLYREALAINSKRTSGENALDTIITHNLARLLYEKGDFNGAEPLFHKTLASFRKLMGNDHVRTARCMTNFALVLNEKGNYAAAEPLFNQALQVQRKQSPQNNADLASTLMGLGNLLVARGEAQKGEPLLREALEMARTRLPAGNWQLAEAESALGACLAALGRYEEAERMLAESHAALKIAPGEQNWRATQSISRLHSLYKSWGRADKAAQFRPSVSIKQ